MAHGYKQGEGLDYVGTFAAVVKPMSTMPFLQWESNTVIGSGTWTWLRLYCKAFLTRPFMMSSPTYLPRNWIRSAS